MPPERRGRTGRRRRDGAEPGAEVQEPAIRPQPRRPFDPVAAVSDDELEAIHRTALTVLQEIGIDILHDEAKALLAEAGADVAPDGNRVRFPADLVEAQIGKPPETFSFHCRNPERTLVFGGDRLIFGAVSSTPNACDFEGGRRVGNFEDYKQFLRLGQVLPAIHMWGGYPVEPTDIHPSVRHLDALHAALTMTDKAIHAYSLGRERVLDGIEMARIARGVDHETLEREPSVITVINSSSPLRLDLTMVEGILRMGDRGQPVVMTPFTLAGAMAPVTLAGAVTQQNAEFLGGLTIHQLNSPGAPFVYGGFTSNVDMRSGAPAFGTPEYMKATLVGGQFARRYRVPYRSSNVNAANAVDAQAAYESVFSLWGAVMGGVNLVKHAAGWMEGGLQASFEKMVLDADLLDMIASFLEPFRVDEAEMALDAMREVGPGGHYFGAEHTQSRYKTAFFAPMVSDWRNYEAWTAAGSPTAADHLHRLYKEKVAQYEAPPMDPAAREELDAFVARRKEEGGVPTDY